MINRFSSRLTRLDRHFLNDRLADAESYDRIAGYFSSSVLEIAGEAIERVKGKVRLICNSEIEKEDCETATAAIASLRREWCEKEPEKIYEFSTERLKRLYHLIKSGKLEVKVLPNDIFGLIHGKAGVVTFTNGSKTSFIGSVNETLAGWRLNYEILWEDSSQEGIEWVQQEFDYFWSHPAAIPLSEFVIEDIRRISERKQIDYIEDWRGNPKPAEAVVESPVYRRELGLWEHQKYFVELAFKNHCKVYGARFLLADQVGLGKTIQLALSGQLMALYGSKPVLIIVPKTLLWQWQDEMNTLLDMPSAVFNGKEWIDENGLKYPPNDDIRKCPRKVGIISQSLIISGRQEYQEQLLAMRYECVIVDESHRARRRDLSKNQDTNRFDANNLYRFLLKISKRTHSMLLATATPVQMYPIEAWDLMNILAQGSDAILGNEYSKWRYEPKKGLDLIMGREEIGNTPENWNELGSWLFNPLPPADEDEMKFGIIRERLGIDEDEPVVFPQKYIAQKDTPLGDRITRIFADNFLLHHNPYIRYIVRRTRSFLENNNNPETGEPYLRKIEVILKGEEDREAVKLPPYLKDAYDCAEEFCGLLAERVRGSGFIKTLLLRRVGSSMIAGKKTAEKMLRWGESTVDDFEEDDDDTFAEDGITTEEKISELKKITEDERQQLQRFIKILEENRETDPKYELALNLLVKERFKDKGCIIFSQYYDSAHWVAGKLSKDLPDDIIGLYAGGDKSGIFINELFKKKTKEDIKRMVKTRDIKILVGTDAASEGLNLQKLGTLINLDLPWNPTRLEQRKGRIQRIGQEREKIVIYNMRYKDSVEDRVHSLLSERLQNISEIFGQLPDVLQDAWVEVALGRIKEAKRLIDGVPQQHPFQIRYEKHIGTTLSWESCETVLNATEKRKCLYEGWR